MVRLYILKDSIQIEWLLGAWAFPWLRDWPVQQQKYAGHLVTTPSIIFTTSALTTDRHTSYLAVMDVLKSYLPPGEGFLPKYLFVVSSTQRLSSITSKQANQVKLAIVSMGNSIQSYSTMHYTSQVYLGSAATGNKSPATPLSGRTFGTYTFVTALIRLYASFHINEVAWYDLATWTFAVSVALLRKTKCVEQVLKINAHQTQVAGFHFFSEWLWFGTTRWNRGLAGPILVASASLPWMLLKRSWYLRA